MKTKRCWMALGCLVGSSWALSAQAQAELPRGKAIVRVFSNFHTGLGKTNDERGFELERSYLGYEYALTPNLKVKGVMDIGTSKQVDDYQHIAYIKNAQLSWKVKGLTLNGGLISCTQFGVQEKFWGHRYVMKSFQDVYKFGNSADLGISVAYDFAPWISADAIVVNGEGYKKLQIKDGLQYGLGLTVRPLKSLTLRLYGGMNEGKLPGQQDVYNVAGFAGYAHPAFAVGVEYNGQYNAGFAEDADRQGVSAYGQVKCCQWLDVFGRYDFVESRRKASKEKDEQTVLLGAEFKLGKYVKLSPNFRLSLPKASDADNEYAAYLSCSFGI